MSAPLHTPWGKQALCASSQGVAGPAGGRLDGTILLPPAVAVLVSAVAAHDRVEPGELLARLAANRAREIGLSALAREVLERAGR